MKKLICSLVIAFLSLTVQAQTFCAANFSSIDTFSGTQFFDQSLTDSTEWVTSWFWDFGDSSTSTLQNPFHSYNSNGWYTVCLTIITSDSCWDSICDTILVGGGSGCQAAFSYADTALTVDFTDLSSGSVTNWDWNFGDGGTSTLQNPSHTYSSAGSYIACLVIYEIDSIGDTLCVADHCYYVNVNCGTTASFTHNANFEVVSFTDNSNGVIASWHWTFGDGDSSSSQNPIHTYSLAGYYQACLTVEDTSGCLADYCTYLYVQCCNADFAYSISGATVHFENESCGYVFDFEWDFGDGNSSTMENPNHTYAAAGTYTVCFIAANIDSMGTCIDTICKNVTVYAGNTCADLSIDLGTWGLRPCQYRTYAVLYCNQGNDTADNAVVTLTLDADLIAQYSSPTWTSISGNDVTWNVGTLLPGECDHIYLTIKVDCSVNAGEVLCVEGTIDPTVGDCNDDDNEAEDCHVVVNSYDPNDKMVASRDLKTKGFVDQEDILATDTLTYQIRFQNTGTADAINIVIEDDLDTDLNLTSVVPGASSHTYTKFEVTNGKLKWTFNGIHLPDSNTNEPASHGFVKFKVAQKPNNVPGTVIHNGADIFFDFNAAVVTNTVVNTVKANVGITDPMIPSNVQVTLYPNPFEHSTTIFVQRDDNSNPLNLTFTIYNILGKEVRRTEGIIIDQFQVQRGDLANGMYIYKVRQDGEVISTGKVVVKK